ncbi:MAG: PASTA domain-containing protein [Planctomycetes bacterium]|nr:PASTA domain-containing protein [Planctomycetota bacterium]
MSESEGNSDNGGAPPEEDPEGLGLSARHRETTLEQIKKSLALREVPVPQLVGYPIHKARKILSLAGVAPERIRLRLSEGPRERGTVVAQRPEPGRQLDLQDPSQRIELTLSDRSLLDLLPQLYQRSDLTGRNFVRDLLQVMQHIQFQTDAKLDNLERFFDAHECPPEFLDYLASWVALTLEAGWSEAKRRSLITKAVELYHLRGTPRGLRVYLRIFTGVDPQIVENAWPFEGFVVGISSTVGVDTILTHRVDRAHSFVVKIPLPIDEVDAQTILRIHRIVEQEKPVHTEYYLVFAEHEEEEYDSAITVGVTSTVGVDTWIQGDEASAYFDPLGGDEGGAMEFVPE